MINDFKGAIKGLDYIPILLTLGIITGCGAQSTLIGALIISFIFCFISINAPFLYAPSILFTVFLSGASVLLGGGFANLFKLLFLSAFFTVLISFFVKNKAFLELSKPSYKGLLSGILASCAVLSFSLILGDKMFPSIALIKYSRTGFLDAVNINSVVIFTAVFAIYYYLKKIKLSYFPSSLTAVILGSLIGLFYKLNSPTIDMGLEAYKQMGTNWFGSGIYLILLSLICAYILCYQTILTAKFIDKNAPVKKILLFSGLSNLISSTLGSIAGSISPISTKNGTNGGGKTNYLNIFSTVLFIVICPLILYFSNYIYISAVSAVLFIKCIEILEKLFTSQKKKNLKSKIIFVLSFLTCLYNIILGAAFVGIVSIFTKKEAK